MNTIRHVVLLLVNIIFIIWQFNPISGANESNGCSDQTHSLLCYCRSSYGRSNLTDRFLAKLSLSQCDGTLPIRHCHRSQFHPPSFHLTQLIPQLTNLSYCFNNTHCLHTLHFIQHCRQCQVIPSLSTHNNSYRTDVCFNFCEQNPSCGFICLNQPTILSVICHVCQGRNQNISCRCIRTSSCLLLSHETTTPRWMQKRGFPAAGILALVILAVALLVIAIKLTYRQLDTIDRRRSLAIGQAQLQQLVVQIHRCDEENELSILLLKKISKN